MKQSLSLKARALAMLARREHSRSELRRKLLPHARAAALEKAAGAAVTPRNPDDLHRLPGPAPARPGIFSSRNAAGAPPKAGPRRGGWDSRGARAGQGGGVADGSNEADSAWAAGRAPDRADDFDVPAPPPAQPAVDTAAAWAEADSDLDVLLDWLQAHRYLSEERFVESRVHARAGRFGNLRIRQELAQHGVALGEEAAQQLRDTELERCRDVWARKFGGEPPADAAARARQMRFLAARGFSTDVIRRVLQARDD